MGLATDTAKEAILGNPLDVNKKPSRQGVVDAFEILDNTKAETSSLTTTNNEVNAIKNNYELSHRPVGTGSINGTDPLVVVATGQSNMLGHGPAMVGDRSTEPGVFVLVYDFTTPANSYWLEGGPDSPDWPFTVSGNGNAGIAYSFCKSLRREQGRDVYLVMSAAGGQPIAEWLPGGGGVPGATGAQWAVLMNKCVWAKTNGPLAVSKSFAGLSFADYFLFHQGEADADYQGGTDATWLARFETFITNCRTPQPSFDNHYLLRPDTPVMVGELLNGGTNGGSSGVGSATDSRNSAIRQYETGRDPYIINVRSSNYRAADNLHFLARDLEDFGLRRYFNAAKRVPKIAKNTSVFTGAIADDIAINIDVPANCIIHLVSGSSTAANCIIAVIGTNIIILSQTSTLFEKGAAAAPYGNGYGTDGKVSVNIDATGLRLGISNRSGGSLSWTARVSVY